jgi:hypothetical protein
VVQKIETLVHLIDDLDGGEATQTVRFGFEGREYEVDLSEKNAAPLLKVLEKYKAVARRVTAGAKSKPYHPVRVGPDPSAVRAWAVANGITVSPKGRVPASVVEAFEKAGN